MARNRKEAWLLIDCELFCGKFDSGIF